ncbi:MAG: PA14 domain-containing protein [Actinomycetota bacterium]
MRLAIASIRETRSGALAAVATLSLLVLLLVGLPASGSAADYNGTITPNGPPVTVTLSTAGDNAYLTFSGTQGQRVSVNLTNVTIGTSACCSAFASIRKPDGSNLVAPKFFGTAGGFLDTVALPSSGTYTIFIDPQGSATGSVTVTVYDVPADVSGAITIGGVKVPISLATPGRNARLSFEGAAGQIVRLTTSEVTIGTSACCSAWASIENPDGSTLGVAQFFGTVGSTFTRTLTASGSHSVFINPVDANTGNVKVTLSIGGVSPADSGHVKTLTPVLRVDPGATPNTDYYFEVATDSAFTNVVNASGALPTTNSYRVLPAALKDATTYYWRWKTTGGSWSTARTFVTSREMFGVREEWSMWSEGALAVNKVTGNLVLSLPGPNYPTAVSSMGAAVTYNSLDSRNRGLGAGWMVNGGDEDAMGPTRLVDLHLLQGEEKMDAADVFFGDGGSILFSHVGQTNSYVAGPGDEALLSKNADGSWTLIDADGSLYTFGIANATSGLATLTGIEVVEAGPGKGKLTYAFSTQEPSKVTSVTDGAGRALTFTWNSLNASACNDAILCITGPDNVRWRYIGDGAGGTSGRLIRVNNGTRDIAAVEYDPVGMVYKLRNANDLDPTAASPGYDPLHEITIAHCCGTGTNRRVMWISDGPITSQGGTSSTTWFDYYPGSVSTTPTRAAHGSLPAGTSRTAAGYATVKPPRQHAEPNPKFIKSYYDDQGREIEKVDILGNVTMAGYDARNHKTWSEDEDGNPTDYSWDPADDVLLTTTGPDPDGAGPQGRPVTTNRYDEKQIGTSSTPGAALEGLQASYYENANLAGRPKVRQTDASVDFSWGTGGPSVLPGVSDNFSVRWVGNLIVTSAGSYTFSTNADDGTRLTIDGIQEIENWVEQSVAVVNSRPVTLSAGAHKILLEYFDATGPAQVQLRWSCSACSPSVPLQTIPASALHPGWLNQTSTVSPLGNVAFNHFAVPSGQRGDYILVRLADGTNVITSYAYDAYGRVTQKVMPKGNAGRTLDAQGNLQGTPDLTYATSWIYYGPTDTAAPPSACGGGTAVSQGELLKEISPRGVATTTNVYNLAGKPIAITKGVGTTCRTYDSEGGVTSQSAPGDPQPTTYTYDPAGALRTAQNDAGTVTNEYDEVGRVKRTVDSFGAEETFEYDREGNLTRRVAAVGALSSNPNYVTTYTYDEANRLISLTDPASRTYNMTYNNRGNLRAVQYPNGTFAWNDYGPAGRLTGVYNRHGTLPSPLPGSVPADSQGSPIVDFAYSYDLEGRRTQEVRSGGGLLSSTTGYAYDTLGRLSELTQPDGTLRRYFFDLDSNRTQITDNGQTVAAYTYDPNSSGSAGVDQLTSVVEGGQTRTFSHRQDGEMTQRGSDTLTWDGWGRNTGGTFGGSTLSYQFDPTGFRRKRESQPSGTITHYRLGGLFQTNSSGAIQLTDVEGSQGDLAHYLGAPTTSTTVSYLYYNAHGDATATADQSGTRTSATTYDPFGVPQQSQPSDTTVEGFTGRWNKKLDTTASIVEMGARPYDPALGRFLAIDPVDSGGLGAYDYVGQDPCDKFDLEGTRLDPGESTAGSNCPGGVRVFAVVYRGGVGPGSLVLTITGVFGRNIDSVSGSVGAIWTKTRTPKVPFYAQPKGRFKRKSKVLNSQFVLPAIARGTVVDIHITVRLSDGEICTYKDRRVVEG